MARESAVRAQRARGHAAFHPLPVSGPPSFLGNNVRQFPGAVVTRPTLPVMSSAVRTKVLKPVYYTVKPFPMRALTASFPGSAWERTAREALSRAALLCRSFCSTLSLIAPTSGK